MESHDGGKQLQAVADLSQAGQRLDSFLAAQSGRSRAYVQKLLQENCVTVNDMPAKANYRLKENDVAVMCMPPAVEMAAEPEDIPIRIVYQDGDICVVDKEQGMVVHPAPGNARGTLVHALLFAMEDLSGIGGALRPGIVHRLDKMTSGLLVVAKNDAAHASLSQQIKEHTARRFYLAIVEGNIKEESGVVEAPIGRHPVERKRMAAVQAGGRSAITRWRVLQRLGRFTLVECALHTGRTHQIRVHMAHIRHPVAGDTVYGPAAAKLGLTGQALHAYRLHIRHPRTGEAMRFYAPPPAYFLRALEKAGWDHAAVWECGEAYNEEWGEGL